MCLFISMNCPSFPHGLHFTVDIMFHHGFELIVNAGCTAKLCHFLQFDISYISVINHIVDIVHTKLLIILRFLTMKVWQSSEFGKTGSVAKLCHFPRHHPAAGTPQLWQWWYYWWKLWSRYLSIFSVKSCLGIVLEWALRHFSINHICFRLVKYSFIDIKYQNLCPSFCGAFPMCDAFLVCVVHFQCVVYVQCVVQVQCVVHLQCLVQVQCVVHVQKIGLDKLGQWDMSVYSDYWQQQAQKKK